MTTVICYDNSSLRRLQQIKPINYENTIVISMISGVTSVHIRHIIYSISEPSDGVFIGDQNVLFLMSDGKLYNVFDLLPDSYGKTTRQCYDAIISYKRRCGFMTAASIGLAIIVAVFAFMTPFALLTLDNTCDAEFLTRSDVRCNTLQRQNIILAYVIILDIIAGCSVFGILFKLLSGDVCCRKCMS
jgi:hypothetical protein